MGLIQPGDPQRNYWRTTTNVPGTYVASDVDDYELGTDEVITLPVHMGIAGSDRVGPAERIQVSGILVGAVNPPFDLTLNYYRCPEADPILRDKTPFRQDIVNYSPGSNPGAELVTNGAFAADATWQKGSGWTITPPTAQLPVDTLESELTQMVTMPTQNNLYLLTVDAQSIEYQSKLVVTLRNNATLQDMVLREYIPKDTAIGGVPERKPALFYWEGGTGARKLSLQARRLVPDDFQAGVGVQLNSVGLRNVNANYHYFTFMLETKDIGDALVVGFAPGGDMTGTFLQGFYRRYS